MATSKPKVQPPQPGRPPAPPAAPVSEQRIRERAYRIYEARRKEGVPGDPVTDWVRAEQELTARRY